MEAEGHNLNSAVAACNENLLMTSSTVDLNMKELQKRRKLTVDSGYDEDLSDVSRRTSLNVVGESELTRTSSLGNIGEDDKIMSSSEDLVFKTITEKIQNSTNLLEELNSPIRSKSMDNMDEYNQPRKKEKRRRMTPVPGSVVMCKPSKNIPSKFEHSPNDRKILFVEEEDLDDIEKYNHEDEFVCPDLQTTASSCKRNTEKRNSWHGVTEGEKIAKKYRHTGCLTKSKSLDRGQIFPRRRKRNTMSIPSISFEDLSLNCKDKTDLTRHKSLDEGIIDTSAQFLFPSKRKNDPIRSTENNNSSLPAWMQEAEADMTSSDTGSNCSDEDSHKLKEEISLKLQIPEINWEKLNEEKNKTNKLLSEQRKEMNKMKNKASSRRRRKLTPSESPSHASLEKLSSLKCSAEEWTVTEEEEEGEY